MISLINPYIFGGGVSPIPPLLDELGVSAATCFGLRKLRSSYSGSALRVRRASDNAEQDIGFVGNDLDWAGAVTFKSASSLTVVTWYDQSGNGHDITQATGSKQPALNTTDLAVVFDGVDDILKKPSGVDYTGFDKETVFVVAKTTANGTQIFAEHGNVSDGAYEILMHVASSGVDFVDVRSYIQAGSLGVGFYTAQKAITLQGDQFLFTHIIDYPAATDDVLCWYNGVLGTVYSPGTSGGAHSGTFPNGFLTLGADIGEANPFQGNIKEFVVILDALNGTDRAIGESNINSYHLIY